MCNEYALEMALLKLLKELSRLGFPPFDWLDNLIPNNLEPRSSVKIRDTAPIMRLGGDKLIGTNTTWAWLSPQGKPVFNFVSEKRDFAKSDRVLIPATGFYEYTTPEAPKVKLKDRHLFTMRGEEWFWIAGVLKENCFSMLTTAPGPDIEPYHDRQIVALRPSAGMEWLTLAKPQSELLAHAPKGTFDVHTLRKDGKTLEDVTQGTLI